MARRPVTPEAPIPDETLTIFDQLPDPETQSLVAFEISCFDPVEALMGQGDWLAILLTQCPSTHLGRKLWKYLKYLRRNFANHASHVPNLSAQTAHFRERAEYYKRVFEEIESLVDEVCHAAHTEETAVVRETELRTLHIPMCVAIAKAIVDAATELGRKTGTFTKSTLNILTKVSVWIVKLNLVAGDMVKDGNLDGGEFEVSLGPRYRMVEAMEGFVQRVSGGLNAIAAQERLLTREQSRDSEGPEAEKPLGMQPNPQSITPSDPVGTEKVRPMTTSNSPDRHASTSSRAPSQDGSVRDEGLSRSTSAPSDARNNPSNEKPPATKSDPSRPVASFTRVDRRAQMREKMARRANGGDAATRRPGSAITPRSTITAPRSVFSLPPDSTFSKESSPTRIVTATAITSTTASSSVSSPVQPRVAGNAQEPSFDSSTSHKELRVSSTNRLDPNTGR